MKLKMLAALTLGVFGCAFASAQTFGFASAGGDLYCNYEQLTYAGNGLWVGFDNFSACGKNISSTLSGFSATVPNVGPSAHGKGVVYGDSIYAVYNGFSEAQWTVFTKLKCNKVKFGKFTGTDGWEGVAAFSGFLAGTNQGWLTCSIPGKNGVAPTKGVSTGAIRRAAEKDNR